jgi:replicative DNA helicase
MPDMIPPHSKDAEESVLGSAMLNKDAILDVSGIIKADDFYDAANREIFKAIISLSEENSPVDIITVSDELQRKGTLELAGGRAYIASLPSKVPSAANAEGYARIVAEKSELRRLIKASDIIKEKSFSENVSASDILDEAEHTIYEIAQKRQRQDYSHIKDIMIENIDEIDRLVQLGGKATGIPTGFKKLDEITSGLQKSDLIVIAARPAMGKSAFALNIALNAAKKADAKVILFNLEMSREQLGQRLLAMESNIELSHIRAGKIGRNDWDKINLATDVLSKVDIMIDDTAGIGINEIKNKCRRMKAEVGLDLIVVDYLQLMEVEGRSENRQQEISKLSRRMKLLAKELDCPVILLSQLSRAPEQRPNKRPILSDLRESGSIEQDADLVIFLYRDDYYNKENSEKPGICEVSIAKNRNGETKTVDLAWVARYTKFSDPA